MKRSVLQSWIVRETGCQSGEELDRWQLERLRDALAYAKERSPFYRDHLGAVSRTAYPRLRPGHPPVPGRARRAAEQLGLDLT